MDGKFRENAEVQECEIISDGGNIKKKRPTEKEVNEKCQRIYKDDRIGRYEARANQRHKHVEKTIKKSLSNYRVNILKISGHRQ